MPCILSSEPINILQDYTNVLRSAKVTAFLTGGFAEVRQFSTPEYGLLAIKTAKYRGDMTRDAMDQVSQYITLFI